MTETKKRAKIYAKMKAWFCPEIEMRCCACVPAKREGERER